MSRKFPKQFRMYLKNEDEPLWSKFKEIAEREERSMAEIVRELVASYVAKHDLGNPQLRLDKLFELKSASLHLPSCTWLNGLDKHTQKIYCLKRTLWIKLSTCKRCHRKNHS